VGYQPVGIYPRRFPVRFSRTAIALICKRHIETVSLDNAGGRRTAKARLYGRAVETWRRPSLNRIHDGDIVGIGVDDIQPVAIHGYILRRSPDLQGLLRMELAVVNLKTIFAEKSHIELSSHRADRIRKIAGPDLPLDGSVSVLRRESLPC